MAQTTEPNDHLKAVPGPCFPKELFAKIFSTACERTDDEYDHLFQFSLAAVSKQWQDIVLNFPCVWAPLCVALNRPVSMTGVQACLDRSGSMPLDIVLYYPETSEGHELEAGRVETLIQALKPHIARCRSLKLYLRTEAALKASLDHLPVRGLAEKLEELVLHISSREPYRINPVIPSFDLEMPILRHLQISGGAAVRLIGRDAVWVGEMERLAALSVTGASNIDMGAVTPGNRLRSLGSQIPDGQYTFPQLKKIRLKQVVGPFEPSHYLACLKQCEHLTISGIHDVKRMLIKLGTNNVSSGDLTGGGGSGGGGSGGSGGTYCRERIMYSVRIVPRKTYIIERKRGPKSVTKIQRSDNRSIVVQLNKVCQSCGLGVCQSRAVLSVEERLGARWAEMGCVGLTLIDSGRLASGQCHNRKDQAYSVPGVASELWGGGSNGGGGSRLGDGGRSVI
ncbi:hypothetical protein BD779DRAFT_1472804 [Infundibulicybe gibba]|nr:hypothetical protein BD779DRAFT_1472804 [Infundibulicybe gibba]